MSGGGSWGSDWGGGGPGDVLDFEKLNLSEMLRKLKEDPKRLVLGVDPASTAVWNKALGRDDEAIVNQLGGPTGDVFDTAQERGINIGPSKASHDIAQIVAGAYGAAGAGGALGGMGGGGAGAPGGAGMGGGPAGGQAGMSAASVPAGAGGGGGGGAAAANFGPGQGGAIPQGGPGGAQSAQPWYNNVSDFFGGGSSGGGFDLNSLNSNPAFRMGMGMMSGNQEGDPYGGAMQGLQGANQEAIAGQQRERDAQLRVALAQMFAEDGNGKNERYAGADVDESRADQLAKQRMLQYTLAGLPFNGNPYAGPNPAVFG